jgi:hypothetical protein
MSEEKIEASSAIPPELQMEMQQLSREDVPLHLKSLDSPDQIIKDLLAAEKQIAEETVRLMKMRHDREKDQWLRLHADKERELLSLKGKLLEQEAQVKNLKNQLNEMDEVQIEQAKRSAEEVQAYRTRERKKWDEIAEEVRNFRELATGAQDRLKTEQERLDQIKKAFRIQEELLKQQLQQAEEEVFTLKERIARQEETYLKEISRRDDELSSVKEALATLKKETDTSLTEKSQIIQRRDEDIVKVQDALQELIIQLNAERQAKNILLEKVSAQDKQIADLTDEQKRLLAQQELDNHNWQKILDDERQVWERFRSELSVKEAITHVELEQQIRQILQRLGPVKKG